MSQKILKSLEKYGLNKKSSKVYLSLVKRLEANISDISKDTSIPRATVYKILIDLEKQDLVSKLMKNRVRYYTLTKINQLERNLREKQDAISNIIPELKNLVFTAKKDSSVKILNGKEGVRLMWEDIMDSFKTSSCKDNFAIAGEGAQKFHPRYFSEWKKTQKKLKIAPQIIYPESLRVVHEKSTRANNSSHVEKRYTNNDISFEGAINLYAGRKVAIASFDDKKPHLIIIDSPEIYKLFLMLWRLMWLHAHD